MRDRIVVVLEAFGYTRKKKRGQDRGVLPVEQANDTPVRVGRLRNDNIAMLEVGMADAEMTEGRVPGDE